MTTRRRFSARALRNRLAEFADSCACCGMPITPSSGLEWDHRVPLELGGEDDLENLQPLCRACHKGKTAEDVGRIAKARRVRDRHVGVRPTHKRKLPGSKGSGWKQTISRGWVRREE